MMSFQVGRPSGLVALVLEAAVGLAAFTFESDFLEVTLGAGLLVEVGLVGERDAADMDNNNVETTKHSKRTYIRSQYCLSVAVLTFILLIAYHNASTRLDT